VIAEAATLGVPLNVPVEVLKFTPLGAAGEMAKLAIAPPVELTLNPVAAVLTALTSDEDERVKAGAAIVEVAETVAAPFAKPLRIVVMVTIDEVFAATPITVTSPDPLIDTAPDALPVPVQVYAAS